MRRRQLTPPPTQATRADAIRFVLGAIMIPLGIAILVRSFAAGITTTAAILMGAAFIGFGLYRVYVGITRYRVYRNMKDKT